MSSATVYDSFLAGFARAAFDWEGDQFSVVLVSGEYQWDMNHTTRSDLGEYELGTMPGYERGGKQLRNRSIEGVAPNGVRLAAGTVGWQNFSGEFRYAVIFQNTGNRSSDILVACTDLGEQKLKGANIVISYDQDGVCIFTPESAGGNGQL